MKPQFELSAEELSAAGEGGVVLDPEAQRAACDLVSEHLRALGVAVEGLEPCGVKGTKGNQEDFLSWVGKDLN